MPAEAIFDTRPHVPHSTMVASDQNSHAGSLLDPTFSLTHPAFKSLAQRITAPRRDGQ